MLGRDADEPQLLAIQDAGVAATALGDVPTGRAGPPPGRARRRRPTSSGSAPPTATPASPTPSPRRSAGCDEPPEVEVLVGSCDVPGSRLLDLVAVMDRLRSPGGCPWDAQQTHESLVPYLIEEAHEAVEAIESGDRDHMAEELGDVLLQVAFHARVAQEDPRRRSTSTTSPAASSRSWSGATRTSSPTSTPTPPPRSSRELGAIKAAEKAGPHVRRCDGIPAGLPALARADKAASRLERAGLSALARGGRGRRRTSARG